MAQRWWVGFLLLLAVNAVVRAEEPLKLDGFALEGWTVADGPKTWIGGAVEEKIDGFAVFHQGFNLANSQWLLLKRGEAALDVFVFTYDTPANAYGLYTVMRRTVVQSTGAESVAVGDEATFHPMGQLVAWVGRCSIVITTAAPKAPDKDAFLAVATRLASQHQGASQKPDLVLGLQKEGLDPASVMYCHYRQPLDQVFYVGEENVLGLGDDVKTPTPVEAVFAKYTFDNRPYQLIAVHYPDEAAATKAAEAFAATVKDDAKTDGTLGAWRDLGLKNGKHTLIYRSGKLLAIVPESPGGDKIKDVVESLSIVVNLPAQGPSCGG